MSDTLSVSRTTKSNGAARRPLRAFHISTSTDRVGACDACATAISSAFAPCPTKSATGCSPYLVFGDHSRGTISGRNSALCDISLDFSKIQSWFIVILCLFRYSTRSPSLEASPKLRRILGIQRWFGLIGQLLAELRRSVAALFLLQSTRQDSISRRTRRTRIPSFKAKVSLAAVRGDITLEFPISNSYLPPYGTVIARLCHLIQTLHREVRRYGAR